MGATLDSLIIYSNDTQILSRFLSDVLDFELIDQDDSILMFKKGFEIKICPTDNDFGDAQRSSLGFTFEGPLEVEDAVHRVDFFNYRYPDYQFMELTSCVTSKKRVFRCPEGRVWTLRQQ